MQDTSGTVPEPSPPSSPERILAAAEQLFGEKGFSSVSLRQVTSAAEVNLAAVNYHFGSKDGLIEAVLRRNVEPINAERLRMLDEYESAASASVELERIVEAFLRPGIVSLSHSEHGRRLLQLYGRVHAEPNPQIHDLFMKMFVPISQRFGAALRRSLPHLSEDEIIWRMHFVIGVMAQTCQEPDRVRHMSNGRIQADSETTLQQLIPFLAAGLRAASQAGGAGTQTKPTSNSSQEHSGGRP